MPAQDAYTHYEPAVDTTSWVHTGEARVSLESSGFVDCILQLEWVQSTGTLTILNPDGASTMVSSSVFQGNLGVTLLDIFFSFYQIKYFQ